MMPCCGDRNKLKCIYKDIDILINNRTNDELCRIKQNIIQSNIYTNTMIAIIMRDNYDMDPDIMDILISSCSPYKDSLITKVALVESIISGPNYIFNIYINRHVNNDITALHLYKTYRNKFTTHNIRTIQHKFNDLKKIDG